MATGRMRGATAGGGRGQVRIIGGRWRGRRLPVQEHPDLRPTADRVRETLFNWLQGEIAGSCCLDLFAGTGALGMEALSRGAAHCTFIDSEVANTRAIAAALATLGGSDQARVACMTATSFLARPEASYNIIFLDPPFADSAVPAIAQQLTDSGLCDRGALVYVETAATADAPVLPVSWRALREKKSAGVRYGLYEIP